MRSLRVQLIAPFIVGTLVLTMFLSWYTYSSARKAVGDAMLLIAETKTAQVAGSISLLFKSMNTNLQNMVADPHVRDVFTATDIVNAKSRATEWLTIITQGNEYYRDIVIVDINGKCVVSSNPGHIGKSYIDKPYVRSALNGMFSLGDSTVGRVTKRFSAVSAGPVDGSAGIAGALILMNDFPRLVDYTVQANGHDDQTVFTALLAPDGQFMAHKDKRLMGNARVTFPDLYSSLFPVGESGETVEYEVEGHTYIGFAKIDPSTEWIVITSGLQREVFASAYQVGATVFGISLVFLAAISMIVVRFANGILSSLLSLIWYAKEVSEGDLNLNLKETTRKDELGVLHRALQRLVQSLRKMLIETEKASKMKGQFLANMSHEIRTPLNAIIGMSHLSIRDAELSPKQKGYLDHIQLAAKSLLGLINDILDLSKIESGMLELEEVPFNLREVLENARTIHATNASSKGLYVTLEYADDLPERFVGDPLRISQVMNNLLSNALKFTSEGGIAIRCFAGLNNAELAGTGHNEIVVSVQDTGIGIAEESIPSLFQSFTQADASITRQFGGTGLGLAISDKIVSMLGGGFKVTSELGKGTNFSFSMLLIEDQKPAEDIEEDLPLDQAFANLGLQGRSILVAEDNAINQLIMQELLEPCGANVVMANNGEEAVEAVQKQKFDIVLMDMQMPLLDGLGATRIIREFIDKDTLPIVAVTANAMKEDKEKGFNCGMNDYITKPIEPKQLLEVLRAWVRKPA